MTQEIINNKERSQFEYHEAGEIAKLEYRFKNGDLVLMHTEVPKMLEGKGIASRLAKFALEWAQSNDLKLIVYCPFVTTYLKKHPEFNFLIR